jgi:hypothetical protein
MIRTLLFADHASDRAPTGGFPNWDIYVNTSPAQPHLHIHGQAASAKDTDWGALVSKSRSGYQAAGGGQGKGFKVYLWKGSLRPPGGASIVAVADKRHGTTSALLELKGSHDVDSVIGEMWLEVARLSGRGVYQIEQSRGDGRLVVRGVGGGY